MNEKDFLLEKFYKKIFRNYYFNNLKKWLLDCDSVLDLGCGWDSPVQLVRKKMFKVGVDGFEPYIEKSREKAIHDKYIKEDVTKVEFQPESFDAVLALDVIEHLPKDKSIEMLGKIEKWAKKKIILSVPNGFMPQEAIDSNQMQAHRCAWSVNELRDLGFKVYCFNGLKGLRKKVLEAGKFKFFWMVLSDITQIYIYFFNKPEWAFNLCAVKELDK